MSPCGGERGSSESLLSLRLQNGVGPVGVWGRRGLQRAGSTASRSASRSGSSVALDVRVCVVRRVAQYRVSRSIACRVRRPCWRRDRLRRCVVRSRSAAPVRDGSGRGRLCGLWSVGTGVCCAEATRSHECQFRSVLSRHSNQLTRMKQTSSARR